MPSFLFSATNANQESVNERVEAENLSQARYKLDLHDYSEIIFFESELSRDVDNLFDEKILKLRDKYTDNQVEIQYDTSNWKSVKSALFIWAMLSIWVYYSQSWLSYSVLTLAVVGCIYITLPAILFNGFETAHIWAANDRVRLWARVIKLFNFVSPIRIPNVIVDHRLSCADAREGNLEAALSRFSKYEFDSKVSGRLFHNQMGSIYESARIFDKVLEWREKSIKEGNDFPEEMLDLAMALARYAKRTQEARQLLEIVVDKEPTFLTLMVIPHCRGLIEVEDGNWVQAEFFLRQAMNEIKPFEKNSYLDGLRSEIKAYLSVALGYIGNRDEALILYNETKQYLIAHREHELMNKCELALA
jgi:hypothetical protein